MMLILFSLLSSISMMSCNLIGIPIHASCEIDWTFGEPCESVHSKIVAQINEWDVEICPMTSEGCSKLPCGQKCLYKLTETTETSITGTHTTPVARYVDDIAFDFTPNGSGCSVHGHSEAQKLLAFLDFGTNYCNLRNLIDGSGLSESNGFTEETSNGVCTQYSTADCTRY